MEKKPAIRSHWKNLLLINYPVDSRLLDPYLPARTEYARWNGECYVSLIGFQFLNLRFKGFRIPYHTNFGEINLRFYVRRKIGNEWRYGVVFIKEMVSLPMVTIIANTFFSEPYHTVPLRYSVHTNGDDILTASYSFKNSGWNTFEINCGTQAEEMAVGSEMEFMTSQYWGYSKVNPKKTLEYEVLHPRWRVYPTIEYKVNLDFGKAYGEQFAFLSDAKPTSAFLAEGSDITLTPQGALFR
ncbi:MAG: DUF2071 domain-containing protein [Bacteroidota bacterium]|nr:DUF2071 domain-containing protein [Bacteroidota bacterium]